MWAVITLIVISLLGIGIAAQQHGEPRTGKHHFGATLIAAAIQQTLLYFGGFYDELLRRLFGS